MRAISRGLICALFAGACARLIGFAAMLGARDPYKVARLRAPQHVTIFAKKIGTPSEYKYSSTPHRRPLILSALLFNHHCPYQRKQLFGRHRCKLFVESSFVAFFTFFFLPSFFVFVFSDALRISIPTTTSYNPSIIAPSLSLQHLNAASR